MQPATSEASLPGAESVSRGVAVPVLRPQLPSAERLLPYLRRIDDSRIYTNYGPLSLELERRLCEHFALPPGGIVCASSGTSALVGAILAAAGRASADRPWAMLPAFTFTATAAAVEQCGYRIYLMDIDRDSWMIDPERVSGHPLLDRVGLVVAVAPFGRPVALAPWRRFREVTGIPIVIDGAASFQGLAEAPHDLLGEIPVAVSFHATKSFATGEGGCVATTDLDLAGRAAQALNFGFMMARDSSSPSTNGKMSEYHAAVGLAELDGWAEKEAALRAVVEGYRRSLADAGLADRFRAVPDIGLNYALFVCRGPYESERVQECLRRRGVDFRLWYGAGLQHQSYFVDCPRDGLDVTERIAPSLIGLPMAPDLSASAVAHVVAALVEACCPAHLHVSTE